jgi:hypothetical protein
VARLSVALAAAAAVHCASALAAQDDLAGVYDEFDRATETPGQDVFAPRVLPGPKRSPDAPATQRFSYTPHVSGTAAAFTMRNNHFAPPPELLPAGIVLDPDWAELFIEAGVTARYAITPAVHAYGGVSYLESATRGHDYSTNGNTTHGLAETAYAGVTVAAASGIAFDLSYGQQDFTIGNGMLLWQGATNGAQRGAAFLGPRLAWASTLIAKATIKELTVAGFWLKPNEAQAVDTGTRLAGIDAQWNPPGPVHAGLMYVHVPQSRIVTRKDLDVLDVRLRWHPFAAVHAFWLQGEYAWEHGDNVTAQGGYAQANYNAQDLPWKPALALEWSWLSGDKPQTAKWEGFDPLYYGNGNPNWYPGKIASLLLANTNLVTASVTLTLNPTASQIVQIWYLDFRAAVANAPLVVPSPGNPVPVGGGVPAKPLAREVDASWTYTFNKAVNVTLIAGYAAPASGYKDLYASFGATASGWWMLGTQFNVSY